MSENEGRPAEPVDPTEEADDTEGHNLQMADFGRTIARDRTREIEQSVRESRMREEPKGKRGRGLFRR
jgi:hypothetical protein